MRHFVFALLIALLPLRGWVGDAMATHMAVHAVTQAVTSSAEGAGEAALVVQAAHHGTFDAGTSGSLVDEAHSSMPPDCIGHNMPAGADVHGGVGSTDDADNACANCSLCQACHTVALLTTLPSASNVIHAALHRPIYGAHFVSAEPVLGQKPPIS